ENVPSATTTAAAVVTRVRPDGNVLHVAQHRLREKKFLFDRKFPVTPFRAVTTLQGLEQAVAELGLPGVLKTAAFGYDGKGQCKLESKKEIISAHAGLGGAEGIYEAWVDYSMEVSVIAARSPSGSMAVYPIFENCHSQHILDLTVAPARIPARLASDAT